MKSRTTLFVRLMAAGAVALAAGVSFAQSSSATALPDLPAATASSPAPAASTPQNGPRAQRLRSPAETGDRATVPGDLRPERPVTPQISIPLGKKAAPPTARQERAAQPGNPAASGAIDDAAARCESQADELARATCRAKLAREAKGQLPG